MRAGHSGTKRLIRRDKSSHPAKSGGAKRVGRRDFNGKPPSIGIKAPGFGWDRNPAQQNCMRLDARVCSAISGRAAAEGGRNQRLSAAEAALERAPQEFLIPNEFLDSQR
jgi:hypothetical protein